MGSISILSRYITMLYRDHFHVFVLLFLLQVY